MSVGLTQLAFHRPVIRLPSVLKPSVEGIIRAWWICSCCYVSSEAVFIPCVPGPVLQALMESSVWATTLQARGVTDTRQVVWPRGHAVGKGTRPCTSARPRTGGADTKPQAVSTGSDAPSSVT